MTDFVSALGGGLISSVITLICAQPIQHYFWKRQRQAERRLAVIDEVSRLAAEFLDRCANVTEPSGLHSYGLRETFFQELHAAEGQVEVLFSAPAFKEFVNMQHLISPGLQEPRPAPTEAFRQARKVALTVLYKEVGIPVLPLRAWQKLQKVIKPHHDR
jgi:hypothetical protein